MPLLLMTAASAAEAPPAQVRVEEFAQLVVRQRIVVRIPASARQVAPASASLIRWKEGRGPKCVPARNIAGATLLGQNSVDLILRDNHRVRAKLENSCPALDYYYGFYITPNPDGLVCADRDTIRSRMGGQCGIARFKSLQAERDD